MVVDVKRARIVRQSMIAVGRILPVRLQAKIRALLSNETMYVGHGVRTGRTAWQGHKPI